jgi:hypothetical protein
LCSTPRIQLHAATSPDAPDNSRRHAPALAFPVSRCVENGFAPDERDVDVPVVRNKL